MNSIRAVSYTHLDVYKRQAVFSSVLAVYLAGQGKSAQELSFIMSAAGLFSILLLPVTGWLLDKTLRPRLISGVLLLSAGMLGLVFSASHSVWAVSYTHLDVYKRQGLSTTAIPNNISTSVRTMWTLFWKKTRPWNLSLNMF